MKSLFCIAVKSELHINRVYLSLRAPVGCMRYGF